MIFIYYTQPPPFGYPDILIFTLHFLSLNDYYLLVMDSKSKWDKEREEWLKQTQPYHGEDVYKPAEINNQVFEGVREII